MRVTHDGYLKGCLNRNDDPHNIGEMTRPEIREVFRETVATRASYCGTYVIQNDGEWTFDEGYIEV